jgi:glycosyltransferase involved in cell wall biosynthesis
VCDQLGLGAGSKLIATVGRLAEAKGHSFLIDAAKPIISRFPEAHFLIIGDGDLRGSLERQTDESGVTENVHFLGYSEVVADLLTAADLFVLPSLWEGLSVALLEAMAAAKPIVATAVAGTEEALVPGRTGLVVPPGDSQALADGILQLLRDPARAQAMGQAARQRVERQFSAERNAAEHVALYRRLSGSGSGR